MENMMLNGKEIQVSNFGADPSKEGFNRYDVNVPEYNTLSSPVKAHLNALSIDQAGYEYAITTLTYIKKKVIEQKFYEINPSEFMPVVVGEGAWLENLVFNNVYMRADDFESGIADSSKPFNKKPSQEIEVIAKPVPIVSWNKSFDYSVIELAKAANANIDLVLEVEKARKKNWDLGIQKIAFVGSNTKPGITGLYNLESVAINTTLINEPISLMTGDEFQAFVATVLKAYAANANSTVLPNRFVMPQTDYLGMAAAAAPTYPMISKLQYLEDAFQRICGKDFKILMTAYGDKARLNAAIGVNKYRYILYRNDAEALEMNIPVAYTTTAFGTPNGFSFQNVAMGQFSGVYGKRPQEALYLDDGTTA